MSLDQLKVAGLFLVMILIGIQLFRIHREDTRRK